MIFLKKYTTLAVVLPFVLFCYTESSYSQSINLEQLGGLTSLIGGEMSPDVSDVDTTDQAQTKRKIDESREETEVQEFGYRGKKDSFIVEPRPKIRKDVSPFGYFQIIK